MKQGMILLMALSALGVAGYAVHGYAIAKPGSTVHPAMGWLPLVANLIVTEWFIINRPHPRRSD